MRRLCLLFCLPLLSGAWRAEACSPEPKRAPAPETVRVTAIRDFGVLLLADGRELRLAPVAVPGERWRGRPSIPVIRRLASRARARLETLALDRDITLSHRAPADRYGRLRAQAFVPSKEGPPLWLQAELLRAGLGRVETGAGTAQCAGELLRIEAQARARGEGLWRLRMFQVRDAARLRRTGSFRIVEGRIRSIAETRSRVWINFGEDWRSDFTVGIRAKAARRWPKDFWRDKTGARVRVRGFVENYNGPMIEATHPAQFEWLEEKRGERGGGRERAG